MSPQGVVGHQLLGNLTGEGWLKTSCNIDTGQLPALRDRARCEFDPLASEIGFFRMACECTETYSPAAIAIAPEISPDTPAKRML